MIITLGYGHKMKWARTEKLRVKSKINKKIGVKSHVN